jgi:hypothetical protein
MFAATERYSVDSTTRKAESERRAFSEFAAAAALDIIPGSLESRPPPEPDILCELAGRGRVAFELVNLVDEDLMRMLARAIRGTVAAVSYGDPTIQLIEEKLLRKTYRTPYAMELLAYGDDTLLPYDVWQPRFEQHLVDLVEESRNVRNHASGDTFDRLWVVNLGRRSRARPVWLVHPPM